MKRALFALFAPLLFTACPRDRERPLTAAEASQALEESTAASQAEGFTAVSVEISTSFTIGQGIERAVEELRDFHASQLPCAEVTLDGATLGIEYGVNPGNCTYRGHTFSGSASVTVSRNDEGQVLVDHEWDGLSNGVVTLDGSAHVTWDFDAGTRRVEHETDWTHIASGRSAQGSGDRTQSVLDGGLAEGIRVDGVRSWSGARGDWDLAIDGVEMRWSDPVPQAGSYNLSTPNGKTLSLSFEREDEDTIVVTIASGERSFSFRVSKSGAQSSAS